MAADDNHFWRKYGEKIVGDARAALSRSYYRCSVGGCPAKKRVDRSVHALPGEEPIAVEHIGSHNHDPSSAHTSSIGFEKPLTNNTNPLQPPASQSIAQGLAAASPSPVQSASTEPRPQQRSTQGAVQNLEAVRAEDIAAAMFEVLQNQLYSQRYAPATRAVPSKAHSEELTASGANSSIHSRTCTPVPVPNPNKSFALVPENTRAAKRGRALSLDDGLEAVRARMVSASELTQFPPYFNKPPQPSASSRASEQPSPRGDLHGEPTSGTGTSSGLGGLHSESNDAEDELRPQARPNLRNGQGRNQRAKSLAAPQSGCEARLSLADFPLYSPAKWNEEDLQPSQGTQSAEGTDQGRVVPSKRGWGHSGTPALLQYNSVNLHDQLIDAQLFAAEDSAASMHRHEVPSCAANIGAPALAGRRNSLVDLPALAFETGCHSLLFELPPNDDKG